MQLMQTVYGLATACEVAYYSYMYAMCAPQQYVRVTSCVRAATLIGKCVAYASSQVQFWRGALIHACA
jgi:thiamine transporter 2/3